MGLGGEKAADSYLRMDLLLDAARAHGAQAIYPGYGFLSESAEFAEACERRALRSWARRRCRSASSA